MATIRHVGPDEMESLVGVLSEVLLDCVAGGASVSFMASLTRERAEAFWRDVGNRVAAGTTDLLVAEQDGTVVGTVQVVAAGPDNQPHRADIAKMLVHRSARGRGVGQALMIAAEDIARARAKTVLVLDTVPGTSADRLYRRLGWTAVGRVPDYALYPDGQLCDTMIFTKALGPSDAGPDGGVKA